jgi:uncharacterized SAM-binding protein YcdF (DUF218 family)
VRRALRFIAVLAIIAVLAVVFHASILTALGAYLDQSGPPQPADVALVLGGDSSGNRIVKGAELVREGYASKVVVSGPSGNYGYYECDLAIPFAVKAGYRESDFVRFPNEARSTEQEAAAAAVELRSLGVHKALLVTSVYHTRRAGRLFRAAMPDISLFVVSAPDPDFTANGWWHNRQARKLFLIEWLKTVANWLHM